MKIPYNNYTIESFLELTVKKPEEVFPVGQPRWLKSYLLYVDKNWKKIFEPLEMTKYGEITRIRFHDNETSSDDDYFAYEWTPGLLLIFSSLTEDTYEKTLKQFINARTGISQTWIKPSVLEQLKNQMVQKYDARIYRFIARRNRFWEYPAQVRPDEDRRLSYSGDDAGQTLKEVQQLYGVIPTSIDMRVGDSKMQLNRNGLVVLRQPTLETIGILQETVEKVIAEQMRIKETSEKLNTRTVSIAFGEREFNLAQVAAGKIILPKAKLTEIKVKRLFKQASEYYDTPHEPDEDEIEEHFSFIDTYVEEDPLTFGATVMDEVKGTVFGLSGINNEIALIPMHRTTFESFIKFYNMINENFDESAQLVTFGERLHV